MEKVPEITIVNLPSPFLEDQMWIYNLGVINMVTYLRTKGYDAELFDLVPLLANENKNLDWKVIQLLKTIKSPIVGVSATTPQARFLPLFLAAFKDGHLVLGGPHATVEKEDGLRFGFDSVVAGEGENLADLVMEKKRGVIFSDPVEDLDQLPYPDRTLVKGYKGPIPIMASRGCPWSCTFCSKTLSSKVRFRSPENVFEEIQELSFMYPEKEEIIFYDEILLQNYEWIERLCWMLRRGGINRKFKCSTRVDRINMEIARLLKVSGFEEIRFGIESGSQKILNILNKKTTVQQNNLAVEICKKVGLKVKAFIMIGCPSESFETLEETESWIDKNKPDFIGLYLYAPLPGSDIWDNFEKYDIKFDKFDYERSYYGGKPGQMFSNVSTSSLSSFEITKFYYYLRKKYGL